MDDARNWGIYEPGPEYCGRKKAIGTYLLITTVRVYGP
jgi:hypothetical protein